MNRAQPLVMAFDLESASLPHEQLAQFKPTFTAPSNYRDEQKIKDSIAEQEAKWIADCALHAHTARILCIGITSGLASVDVIHAGTEADILTRFWHWLELNLAQSVKVAGHNSVKFDLPFLVKRSWVNDVDVPNIIRRGRFWHDDLYDTMEAWGCGVYGATISLDNLAKAFGVGTKTGNGANFASLWETDRKAAILYVENDVTLVRKCAERMLGYKPASKASEIIDVPML